MSRRLSLFFLLIFLSSFNVYSVNVTDETSLQTAIESANSAAQTINFLNDIPYARVFYPLNVNPDFSDAGQTYTINGNNYRLVVSSGNFPGFFSRGGAAGQITIQNLTIENATGKGGDSASNGGGGAGLGGGLFIDAGSSVVLDNVSFRNCSAQGGSSLTSIVSGGGGGGGFYGNGEVGSTYSGGGGGGLIGNGGTGNIVAGGGGGAQTDGVNAAVTVGGDGGDDFNNLNGGTGGGIGVAGTAGGSGGGGGGSGYFAPNGSTGGKGGTAAAVVAMLFLILVIL